MPADHPSGGPVPIIAGLRQLADRYDGFILDLWGVLHDGVRPFPGVIDALERLVAGGKRLAILSNAPRRIDAVTQRMTEIGIPRRLYHHALSSGEETWRHLERRDDSFYAALGPRCYQIASPREEESLEAIGFRRVRSVEEADFILNTGPWGWDETVADYEDRLRLARSRGLPMICANPDLVVMHDGRMAICAGALAQRYEEMGGRVRWHGKPYPSVYETVFGLLGLADRRRILAVGDSFRTDIAGANGVGIDSVLVAGGIHAEEFGLRVGELPDRARLDAAIAAAGQRPSAVIAHFAW